MSLGPNYKPREDPSYKPKEREIAFEELSPNLSPRVRRDLAESYRCELIRPDGCTGDTPGEIAINLVLELSRETPGVRFTVIQRDGCELPEVQIKQLPRDA